MNQKLTFEKFTEDISFIEDNPFISLYVQKKYHDENESIKELYVEFLEVMEYLIDPLRETLKKVYIDDEASQKRFLKIYEEQLDYQQIPPMIKYNREEKNMTFKQIVDTKEIKIPTDLKAVRKIMNYHTEDNLSFELDKESYDYLKGKLNLVGRVYYPTMKRFANSILKMEKLGIL